MTPKPETTTGRRVETTGTALQVSSVPPLMDRMNREQLAAKAASDLVDLLPPQDVPHPQKMMAGVITTLVKYHQHVIEQAPVVIAQRTNRLTLHVVTEVCIELQDAVSRQIERERNLMLPSAEVDQATRDKQVADYEARVKPVLLSAFQKMPAAEPRPSINDGRHAHRIAADLAARKARNEAQANSTGPPGENAA